jgi:hypothetical protein
MKNIVMLSPLKNLALLLASCFLASCASSPQIGAYQRAVREAGFVAYNQPIGDVQNENDWNKFGPGTVLRTKQQTYYYPAKTVIGAAGVQSAMNPKNASQIGLFSGRKVSGYDLDGQGGWTLDAVNEISATIGLKRDTTVDLQLGKCYLANPLGEGAMHQALAGAAKIMDSTARQALGKGQFACVQNAVWADSVRYTFKQASSNSASATYKLSAQDIAALNAKGYKTIDGGVEINTPVFIAYTPLPNPGNDVPKH